MSLKERFLFLLWMWINLIHTTQANSLPYVATLSVGPEWAKAGQSQTLFLTPEIEKSYIANRPTHLLVGGEFFLGLQKNIHPHWQGQLGLAIAGAGNAKSTGTIWDDADPQFNNYTYTYRISHTHLALKGKLLMDQGYTFIPWVNGSLGIGFNRAHAFENWPSIFQAVQTSNFSSHTTSAFVYTIGLGAQKILDPHWQAGAGYEFSDWGKSQLGPAEGQALNRGLLADHTYTHALLFNFTYVA